MKNRKPVGFAVYESVRLPIYFRPVRIKIKASPQIECINGEARSSNEPSFKTYDSFQIAFYESGRWRTARAPNDL